jgi:hypothetical protein
LKTRWHKVIHDEDTGEKRGETSRAGSSFAKAKSGKNLGWGPRIFPAGRTPGEFFTALFGFGILNSELPAKVQVGLTIKKPLNYHFLLWILVKKADKLLRGRITKLDIRVRLIISSL